MIILLIIIDFNLQLIVLSLKTIVTSFQNASTVEITFPSLYTNCKTKSRFFDNFHNHFILLISISNLHYALGFLSVITFYTQPFMEGGVTYL